jgi:hypothetical protein
VEEGEREGREERKGKDAWRRPPVMEKFEQAVVENGEGGAPSSPSARDVEEGERE